MDTAIKEIEMLNANTIEEKLPVFAAQLKSRHGAYWKGLLEKTKQLLLQLGNYNILQTAGYACITTPCLILLGDKDKMVTPAETIAVYEALPNGKYSSLPNTSHPIERVDVALLAGIIKEFIQ
jgi:pimeloyl-ACP methyl ester carboxylesterase